MRRGSNLDEAAKAIARGGIIAYPTEGVFGLGCDPASEDVVEKLIHLKDRTTDKGLILIAAERAQIEPYTGSISQPVENKLQQSWPGPVTWILPAAVSTSALLTGGRRTIAARVTAFETAAALCHACGHALISTSANRSGESPCTTATEVASSFTDLDYIFDHPVGTLSGPTPIFDGMTGKQLR